MTAVVITALLLVILVGVLLCVKSHRLAQKAKLYNKLKALLPDYQSKFLVVAKQEDVISIMMELTALCTKLEILKYKYETLEAGSLKEALDSIALQYSKVVHEIYTKILEVNKLLAEFGSRIVETQTMMAALCPDLWKADSRELEELLKPFENTMAPVTNAQIAITPFTEAFDAVMEAMRYSDNKLTDEELNIAAAKKTLEYLSRRQKHFHNSFDNF